MRKRVLLAIFTAVMVAGFATNTMAASEKMVITHPENGVTEGSVEEKCVIIDGQYYSVNNTRATFLEYVGIGENDRGPWEHGVLPSGMVFSNYVNKMYWHGSSARGSFGTDRSEWVPANDKSFASIQTTWTDGNRAFWRVDENME